MIYVLLGTGFEETEAVAPVDIMRRAGLDVAFAAVSERVVTGSHGIRITADCLLSEIDLLKAEAIVLPGGAVMTPGNYGSDEKALEAIKAFALSGGQIGAICAAPTVLGGLGLLEGKKAVCYPGMEEGLKGAIPQLGEKVVADGAYLTAQGPGSAIEFGLNLAARFAGREAAEQVRKGMHYGEVRYVLTVKDEKRLLRKKLRALPKQAMDGARTAEKIVAYPQYKDAKCVFAFISVGKEAPTEDFIRKALADGKRVCVPLCYEGGIMEAKEITSLSDLVPGMYGIPEPGRDAPTVRADLIDFALVPGLSFDSEGGRLGKGAGYYDRFLAETKAFTLGLCPAQNAVDRVPMEPWDIHVDAVLTV